MRVLIAGLGENKEFGLSSLRDAGHVVGVIDLPHRIPIDLCDWWRPGDRFSVQSMLDAASSADEDWDAVLCWEELSTDVARQVARKLGVPAPRMPLGNFRDKGVMHGVLREHGLPTPHLGVARDARACSELAGGRFPIVVKPADYGGSGGVRIVRDPGDVPAAFSAAAAASATGRVVVDRFVAGPEFSVESVTWAPGDTQVLSVIAKQLTPPPFCVEVGHMSPADVSDADRTALVEATRRVLVALDMGAGVSHAEFRLTAEGPMLMEVAGRPAGGQIPRLVALTTGWNLNLAELAAVSGGRCVPAAPTADCAAVRFFVGDGHTPWHEPVGLTEAAADPLLGTLRELRYSGGIPRVPRQARGPEDRLGWAIVAGSHDNVTAALAAVDAVRQGVTR